MSKDLNHCTFIGRLGKDPETRYLQNGDAVTNLTLAVGDKWKNKQSGEMQESTEWIRLTAFRHLAEICGKYLKKGSKIYASGQFKTRKWQNQDGVDQHSTEISMREMIMLDSNTSGATGQPQQQPQPQAQQPPADDFEDLDIPF